MKINILKPVTIAGLLVFALACSTRKDTWVNRNSHALSTKYNILYNGGLAMDAGQIDLQTLYADNYWEVLPVEQMQPLPTREELAALEAAAEAAQLAETQAKLKAKGARGKGNDPIAEPSKPATVQVNRNPNFLRAEEKATKAIQKHSMNIGGAEKNPQMDEAHLMLGQARYYDQRYLPALEAFNYVLYKYPQSSSIYEVKVWKEKTNMRLENETQTIKNLRELLKEAKLKDQTRADAHATLAQAFINTQEKDSAIGRLHQAVKFTKKDEEKSRYQFIIGQLFDQLKQADSADAYYQKVIDMNRRGPRMYMIQSKMRMASRFDRTKGDTLAFNEQFEKLLNDRENRPYLDWINHQYALYYDKSGKPQQALKYYNKSLDAGPTDQYLNASNYRNMAEIYFNQAKYVTAGIYYDSTMIHMDDRTREFRSILKKRNNLEDVIKYETIAQTNDSILKVVGMSESDRLAYYQKHIDKIKAEDEKKRKELEKEKQIAENSARAAAAADNMASSKAPSAPVIGTKLKGGVFYFYSPSLVQVGQQDFKKNFGNRTLQDNWRYNRSSGPNLTDDADNAVADAAAEDGKKAEEIDVRYTTQYYIEQLPTDQKLLDSLAKDRNFAYYQLGMIYKEKFKEYGRAADKLEKLLDNQPEERLILPAQYNLFKIYEITNNPKAAAIRQDIIKFYPDSRYAQILSQNGANNMAKLAPETAYDQLFKEYEIGDYVALFPKIEEAIDQFTGEEIVPKLELLKARTIGKMRGVEEYKKALNYTALTYPNSPEGKEAELILRRDVVMLEYMQINDREPKSWKILYRAANPKAKNSVALQDKLKKFISERTADQLTLSVDFYTPEMNFITMHGIQTKEGAQGIASVLKEFKEYKIVDVPIIISSENYAVVQVKKNLEEYLADPDKQPEKRPLPNLNSVVDVKTDKQKLQPRARKQNNKAAAAKKSLPFSTGISSEAQMPRALDGVQKKSTTPSTPRTNPNMAPPGK